MAYITAISTTNSINVDFGVYGGVIVSTGKVPNKRCFRKEHIVFSLVENGAYIEAQTIYNDLSFPISYNGATGTFKVDSIDSVTPTDNNHLYSLLIALIS